VPQYEYKVVGVKALAEGDYKEAGRAASEYSVSLVKNFALKGSATLVSVGDVHGLLTADHVWRHVVEGAGDDFCMTLANAPQRFNYPFEGCTPITVGKYSSSHAEDGPDLAFIRLDNPEKLHRIKSLKSFYPLDPGRDQFNDIPYDQTRWVVCGAPAEKSFESDPAKGKRILKVGQFAGFATFKEKSVRGEFDYVKIKISSGSNGFPNHYHGVSGGGAWIPFRYCEDPEGKIESPTLRVFLAGVAYYQVPAEDTRPKTLICHGPKSIYERVVQAVRP